MPAGRVDNGESYLQAAIREAKEEVGVDVLAKDFQLVLTACRKHPDSYWVDAVFEAKEWSGELYNAEPHVHGELTGFAPMELPENVVPNVREYMAYLEAGKNYIEIGWDEEA